MAGSVGQDHSLAGAPIAVGRHRAALGQEPAQGTGLEDPSLQEQELEQKNGWNKSRS